MTTEVEQVSLQQLRSAPRNANRMDPARQEKLREAIAKEGFLQPILVRRYDGGIEIVDGHHRVDAARELGMESVPAIVKDYTPAEAGRMAILMNRLRGNLDMTEVSAAFADLIDSGVPPELLVATGFSNEEVDALLAAAEETVDDMPPSMGSTPEDSSDEVTKPWVIEIEFTDRETYGRAKRGLKKAAGRGNDLSAGLLRLLGEEQA